MVQVRLHPDLVGRDYESVDFNGSSHTVEKEYRSYNIELAKKLYVDNFNRRPSMKHDYYQFIFNSEEIPKFEELLTKLRTSKDKVVVKEVQEVKDIKIDIPKKIEKPEIVEKPVEKKTIFKRSK